MLRQRFSPLLTLLVLCLLLAFVPHAHAQARTLTSLYIPHTELATGQMLGPGYDKRSFYLRIDGGPWQKTYTGPQYNSAAQGKLMNFRAANAIFDDEHRSDFSPDANTNAFIANFDDYKAHGVLAFTISLQGGFPGYEGALASAFASNGSLKSAWMDRAARVIRAADVRHMVVILTYFYQRQGHVLAGDSAVRQAVTNATDWLIQSNYRNVVIEIANEFNLPGSSFPAIVSSNSMTNGIGELINLAKSRFVGRAYRLPVTASSKDATFDGAVRQASDIVHIHGNWQSVESKVSGARSLYASDANGPIVMNEDENGDGVSPSVLQTEKDAATGLFNSGASWGLMRIQYNQYYPFHWSLGASSDISTGSQANLERAVFEHIRSLTMISAPVAPSPTPSATATSTAQHVSRTHPCALPSHSHACMPRKNASRTPVHTPKRKASRTPTKAPAIPAVTSFTLINADTNQAIETLHNGAILKLSTLPTRNLNIRANTNPATVGSVVFGYDGNATYHVEAAAPYSFAGDNAGKYYAWTPGIGMHTLTATPYSGAQASGAAGRSLTISFTVANA